MAPRVLVTGATSGIARATIPRLRERGFDVWGTARSPGDLDDLEQRGVRAVRLDLREPDAIAQAAAQLRGQALDGLVHNAGIGVPGAVEDLGFEAWRKQFDVNVVGPVALTRELAPALREAGGRVVLVSSLAALTHVPYYGAYCASKAALESVGDALRLETAATGVDVCMVEPGPVSTAFQDRSRRLLEQHVDVDASPHREAYEGVDAAIVDSLPRVDADDVAAAIERGLTAGRVPTRIPVGRWAWLGAKVLGWLPDRAQDAILRRLFSR